MRIFLAEIKKVYSRKANYTAACSGFYGLNAQKNKINTKANAQQVVNPVT